MESGAKSAEKVAKSLESLLIENKIMCWGASKKDFLQKKIKDNFIEITHYARNLDLSGSHFMYSAEIETKKDRFENILFYDKQIHIFFGRKHGYW